MKTLTVPTITLSIQPHHNEPRLFAGFPYNKDLIAIIKGIPGARWYRQLAIKKLR